MNTPIFNNTENKCIKDRYNKEHWISRSAAVIGVLMFRTDYNVYVLAEKRSEKMDQPGKYCVVSGYLDWDENSMECLHRESYEETFLDLRAIQKYLKHETKNSYPFHTKTDPGENRQNITISHFKYYDFGDELTYHLLEAERFKNDEIEEIKLIDINDIGNYNWAFDHDKRILEAFNIVNNLEGNTLPLRLNF